MKEKGRNPIIKIDDFNKTDSVNEVEMILT
jgi:hypothetical protein